ncbi:hypothetical protein [Lacrimispora sp.]|uniref:hypothetical protein n=1 Tax=Lacrimispora sp. TaxID=2719234 RepID=UPI00345FCD46
MKIVTEDSERQLSSIMLEKFLKVDFINGNGNFREYFDKEKSPFIAFYDCNPKNKELFAEFSSLFTIYNSPGKQQYLIPVICTEFYIIKSLSTLNYDFKFRYGWMETVLKHTLDKKLVKNMPPKELGYAGSNKNFETQCKMVLSNSAAFYHNVDKEAVDGKGDTGKYYTEDGKHTIKEKVMDFARHIPCVVFNCEKPEGFNRVSNILDVVHREIGRYQEWADSSYRVVLPDNWWEGDCPEGGL